MVRWAIQGYFDVLERDENLVELEVGMTRQIDFNMKLSELGCSPAIDLRATCLQNKSIEILSQSN